MLSRKVFTNFRFCVQFVDFLLDRSFMDKSPEKILDFDAARAYMGLQFGCSDVCFGV